MAIEVEKKFTLKDGDLGKVIKGADFVSEKTFTDVYFDDSAYSLSKRDMWLRKRDGKYELKIPLNNGLGTNKRKLDQFEELDEISKIKKALDKPLDKYSPYATITTTRKKYKKGEFTIDLDVMDFGYQIGEIELMVNDKSQIEEALNKILNFAKDRDLSVAPVRGKVLEYIKRNDPKQYQALEEAGIV